jgi:hypothetical protein
MKFHRVWLAAGLLIFVLQACNPGKRDANRSSNQSTNRAQVDSPSPEATPTGIVKEVHIAKDNGKGAPGEETNAFGPADRTIHCVVELAEAKSGSKIKISWWIVEAEGAKDEKIEDFEYTTKGEDSMVHGHLSMPEDWPPGKYKVEVYVNGTLEKTVGYTVT